MEAEVQWLQFSLSFLLTVQWLHMAQLSSSRAIWWLGEVKAEHKIDAFPLFVK